MKKWKCTVCGYIHTGDEPPEKCPVCGADRSLFVELPSEETAEKGAVGPQSADAGEVRRTRASGWKCTVCGYIHKEEEAPDPCPVCGSETNLFEGIHDESEPITVVADVPESRPMQPVQLPGPTEKAGVNPDAHLKNRLYDMVTRLMTKHHAHPISVHIPNGVLPISALFLTLSVFFGCESLATAALWNMVIVVLAMPVVLFSGYNDWQRRYGGHMTQVFQTKIVCGCVVLISSLILTIWLAIDTNLLAAASTGRRFFFFLCLIMVAAAVVAGLMGGKLVFINKNSE